MTRTRVLLFVAGLAGAVAMLGVGAATEGDEESPAFDRTEAVEELTFGWYDG